MRNSLSIARHASAGVIVLGMVLAGAAFATEAVYKWTDSTGHSHYSQTVPEGQKYQTITPAGAVSTPAAMATGGSETPATASSTGSTGNAMTKPANGKTPADVAREKYCSTARANVQTLTERPLVDMDITGDGKPERLTPTQQTQQLNNAKKQVAALCTN